ncbi:MAG: hypothetical protein GQ565_02455 [Candidatus Aegiribacteria sp.]|nr:hypothetical protein [Candidatus Aegiribacteria sp.]
MRIAIILTIILFVIAPAKTIVQTFDSPTGDISGLGWGDGNLWATDASTKQVYKIDPGSGNVLNSFTTLITAAYEATGLAVENDIVYIAAWNNTTNAYVYKYSYSGTYIGYASMCGG